VTAQAFLQAPTGELLGNRMIGPAQNIGHLGQINGVLL
jgi:hypothetical protein